MRSDPKGPVIILLVTVLAACRTGAGASAERVPGGAPARAPLLLSLQRDTCFGLCPAYRIEVDRYGGLRYEGRSNVCTPGRAAGWLPREKLDDLRAAIDRSGFATMPAHCCDCPISDTPAITVMVADPPPPKTIVDSLGDCPQAGTSVRDLAVMIDEIVGIERWIGSSQERDRCQW